MDYPIAKEEATVPNEAFCHEHTCILYLAGPLIPGFVNYNSPQCLGMGLARSCIGPSGTAIIC